MSFKFTDVQKEEIFEDLDDELIYVRRVLAQYHIHSETHLETYDFIDEEKYRLFFKQFGESENEEWKIKTDCDWNFGKFPYRKSSDGANGLFRILKTGGGCSVGTEAPFNDDESIALEYSYLDGFRKHNGHLLIFDVIIEDIRGKEVSTSLALPNEVVELKEISSYFQLLIWNDLIFIINPEYSMLYVIAYTDRN